MWVFLVSNMPTSLSISSLAPAILESLSQTSFLHPSWIWGSSTGKNTPGRTTDYVRTLRAPPGLAAPAQPTGPPPPPCPWPRTPFQILQANCWPLFFVKVSRKTCLRKGTGTLSPTTICLKLGVVLQSKVLYSVFRKRTFSGMLSSPILSIKNSRGTTLYTLDF